MEDYIILRNKVGDTLIRMGKDIKTNNKEDFSQVALLIQSIRADIERGRYNTTVRDWSRWSKENWRV